MQLQFNLFSSYTFIILASDHTLPEDIPTTIELTEMVLIIFVCGHQSLKIFLAHADPTMFQNVCVLRVVMGKER